MKKTIYSILLAVLMMLWAVPQMWGQNLSDISVCASATAIVAGNEGGFVDVQQQKDDTPDFASMSVNRLYYYNVDIQNFMEYNSQVVLAYYYARPDAGYYFKQWNKKETAENFTDSIHIDSLYCNRVEIQPGVSYWGPFDGDGFKLCDNGQYFNAQGPCGGKLYSEPQSIGTYEAVFAPIPVRSCTSGQVETFYTDEDNKNWNITFSTSYARSISDFKTPSFTNSTGGTFSLNLNEDVTFDNNVITVPVSFTPADPAVEGSFTADLTVSSKGGASLTVQVKAIVEVHPKEGVVATVINGTATPQHCQSFEEALAAVPADGTLQLRRDIILSATQNITKTFTLDLNGKVLSSEVASPILNINGGKLTIVDSKMIGQISLTAAADAANDAPAVCVTNGSLTMNRGTIAAKANSATKGAMAVQVLPGGTFTLNDGLLQATAHNNAAAIMNNGGTVLMKAGELQATAATNVATLAAYAGTTTVENGSITATLTGLNTGAGVYVFNGATVTVQRAKVTATATSNFTDTLFAAYAEGNLTVSKKATLNAISGNENNGYALYWTNSANVTLDGVKLVAENAYGNTFELNMESGAIKRLSLQGAFFVTDKETINETYSAYITTDVDIYRVSAGVEYENGYNAFVGTSYAKAKENGVSIFRIANKSFTTLEDALLYAQNNPSEGVTILQVNDYTLPAGYYTLPANATLLIPYDKSQVAPRYAAVKRVADAQLPTPYIHLTMISGSNLDVYGNIEVGGKQKSAEAGLLSDVSAGSGAYVTGSFGWMTMETGSAMTLEGGATLYAWGYLTGKGEIEARRGATVREFFHIQDWPGAGKAIQRWMNGIFPLNQYFIQNVEAPVSYHPGSKLFASFAATQKNLITLASDVIQIIGVGKDNAMFLMDDDADADNTWVRKWYDVENDKQVYDVNSGAHLGSMVIPLPTLGALCADEAIQNILKNKLQTTDPVYVDGFDSKLFILPLTGNMKIHLLTGALDITQATEMLPGTEIEVDKGATITLNEFLKMDDGTKKEVHLYMFDNDQWGDYAYKCDTCSHGRANQIEYTPSTADNKPVSRDLVNLPDAKLNIHGTIVINGKLYTSVNSDVENDVTSTANIYSTNSDAGTITFNQTMPATEVDGVVTIKPEVGKDVSFIPARLGNTAGQDPAYAKSVGAEAGQSFCFVNDRWTTMTTADPFVYDNYGQWYIKPAAYVAIATQPDTQGDEYTNTDTQPRENADHTYSDAAGEGRLFIYTPDDEQWWEVTLENNLYRSTQGAYYTYEDNYGWVEKIYHVRFVNYDGKDIPSAESDSTVYELKYGIMPKYNGTNPTRAENVDYTYTFTGWSPAFVPVTEDAVYTATYEATRRKYTITFLNENGTEIERHFLTRDEVPACDNLPTKTGYYLQWSPAIGAVTGNQTYQATFLPEPPTKFTITFKNYDGSVLQTSENVEIGTQISMLYNGEPTKPATDEFAYNFTGWAPAITDKTVATEDMTFVAQYSEARKQATVIFIDEKGDTIPFKDENGNTRSVQKVEVGQTPVVPDYTKDATAQFTYTVTWDPTVQAVLKDTAITYKAVVTPTTNKYTVTVNATGCVATGVGTYDYGTQVTLSLTASENYEDPVWSDGARGNKELTVEGDITLSASASLKTAAQTLAVGAGATTTLTIADRDTRYAAFTIEANQDEAGQLIGAEYLTLMAGAKAYYKYTFPTAQAKKWFGLSVPFECDATTLTTATGTTLVLDRHYDIIQYNGATRAAQGANKSAWEYLADKGITTLTPGRLYMIIFASAQPSATFTKKGSAPVAYLNNVALHTYPSTTGDDKDGNWNGIANPRLYKAKLNASSQYGQAYDATDETYQLITTLTDEVLHFGKPVFVQATANCNLGITNASAAPLRRQVAAENDRTEITLAANNKVTDRIILHISDEAMDEYTVGEDLAKMGVSTKVGQMWVNRYNARLCVNTVAADQNVADYPLGISAPKAQAYTLRAQNDGQTTVYLLENGQIIANLSKAAYTIDLSKGTTNAYTIRLVQGKRDVPTDINAALGEQNGVEKVMLNGQLYILREGQVYDATGHRVK
ncbi:MAG: hypothetical protein IJ838_04280 [Paludibacteraceae bacterium]|nr:hypothetical protein [Paludibacteraceae bacterium]